MSTFQNRADMRRLLIMLVMLVLTIPVVSRAQDSTRTRPAALHNTTWMNVVADIGANVLILKADGTVFVGFVPYKRTLTGRSLEVKNLLGWNGTWWVEQDYVLCVKSAPLPSVKNSKADCRAATLSGDELQWGDLTYVKLDANT